ncbi:hypothetical protein L7F22_014117 [Adiantum nelumboides]|nr:hypothetical protein [Adiantum nelumboides]
MIRHILGRLPRTKPAKPDNNEETVGQPSVSAGGFINSIKALSAQGPSSAHTGSYGKTGPESSTLNSVATSRIANGARTVPFPVSDNPFSFSQEPLPLFRDVPISEKENLFIRKLNICTVVFDFTDGSKNVKEKEIKKQTLHELADYVSSATAPFSEIVIEDAAKMVAANIFRSLPPSLHESPGMESVDFDEEEPAMEPAWSHLQIVYEFFLRLVMSSETDAKVAKRYINHSFVLKLLDLFDSEDSRERDYLKSILHRIYGKFMVHRPFIRKAINNIFYRFIFETERHNGILELLEILGSIVNGFALPLKEEHKIFLVRALIPLHKPKCVSIYHRQLSYCITLFVEKDLKLADTVIRGLLKYWPVTNSHKEVLFLGELEEVLEATQPAEFQRCMVPLFRQIGRCLNSPHFQVQYPPTLIFFFWALLSLCVSSHVLQVLLDALRALPYTFDIYGC